MPLLARCWRLPASASFPFKAFRCAFSVANVEDCDVSGSEQADEIPDKSKTKKLIPFSECSDEFRDKVRCLHEGDPNLWSLWRIAKSYSISINTVRRILDSKCTSAVKQPDAVGSMSLSPSPRDKHDMRRLEHRTNKSVSTAVHDDVCMLPSDGPFIKLYKSHLMSLKNMDEGRLKNAPSTEAALRTIGDFVRESLDAVGQLDLNFEPAAERHETAAATRRPSLRLPRTRRSLNAAKGSIKESLIRAT
ncbi:unnamed protein product [Soboliphyme baturini]|uniref:HTH psq-type domain-containing protein n=1 Tax=Soboliphyme baturini TaxID=241478 RepID=A0A183IKA5_9BILA|nr:unnamed protein product [Soboliphyme baturini]